MGFVNDACYSISQAISITAAAAGVFIALGGLIVSLSNAHGTFTSLAFTFFGVFCAKEVYEYSYAKVKLQKQVNRLDDETDQLERGVEDINRERAKLESENKDFRESNNKLKASNKEAKSVVKELRTEVNTLTKRVAELDELVATERNNVEELNKITKDQRQQLTDGALQLDRQVQLTNQAEAFSSDLQQRLAEAHNMISQHEANLAASNEQITELTNMLENSKKMVTNLILAGDDYKKFNGKFGSHLTELGQTSIDLKRHTELLGKMVNSLAKTVPEEKIHQIELVPEVVGDTAKKQRKFSALEMKRAAAIQRMNQQ